MSAKLKGKPYVHTMINKVMYALVMFLANALVTRALGTALKGEYTYVINVANIVAIIAGLGVYQSIPFYNRKADGKYDVVQEYLNIFILQFIIYFMISAVVFIVCGYKISIALICMLVLVDTLSQQLNMLLLIHDIFMRNRIFIWGAYVNLVASVFCYIFAKDNLVAAVFVLVVMKLFYVIGYIIVSGRFPKPFQVKWKTFIEKVHFGYIPMLSFLMITLNYKVDVLMLKAAKSVSRTQLSYYSTGVAIAELAWFIPDVFKEVLFSKTAKKNNYDEISAVIRISNAVIFCIILGIIALGRPFIGIVYGKEFVPSYGVTIMLFLGIPAMSWFKIIYTLFNAQGKRKTSFSVLGASAVINIGMNFATIPYLGIYGAALASIVSYIVCGIVFIILYAKLSGDKVRNLIIMKKSDIKVLLR